MKKKISCIAFALFLIQGSFVRADEIIAVIDSLHLLLDKREGKERVETLLDISEAYRVISFEKTLETGRDAVDKAEQEGLIALKAKSLKSLGVSAYMIGDYELARQYYTESMEAYGTIDDYEGLAACISNIGMLEQYQGNFEKALDFFNQSIALEEIAGNKAGIGLSLVNIASLYYRHGLFNQAYDYYYRGLLVYEEIGDLNNAAIVRYHLTLIDWQWGDYQVAIDGIKEILKVFIEMDMKKHTAEAYNNLAQIYADEFDDYETAIDFHLRSIEIREAIADMPSLALAHSNLGSVYARNEEYDLAKKYLERAMKVFVNSNHVYGILLTHFYYGNLYFFIGDFSMSSEHFNKSLSLAEKHNINEFKVEIIKSQIRTYAASGDFPKFMDFFGMYSAEYDSVAKRLSDIHKDEHIVNRKYDDIILENRNMLIYQQQIEKQLRGYRLSFSALVALLFGLLLFYYLRKLKA
jgi:tetratricopeptide (TPR) repeat protein